MQEDIRGLEGIITSLAGHIRIVEALGLAESAAILRIAKLDLQTKLHGISDRELDAFCAAVEAQGRPSATVHSLRRHSAR